jgi:hypothetical protein
MNFINKACQLERKNELKSLSTKIRQKRQEYRDAQRAHQELHNKYNLPKLLSINDCLYGSIPVKQIRREISISIFNLNDLLNKLNYLQDKFRILHTIYCLYNGTPLDKIEKRVYHYNVLDKMFRYDNSISHKEYIKELGRYWKWKYAFTNSCVKWEDYESALNHQKLLEKRKLFIKLQNVNLY